VTRVSRHVKDHFIPHARNNYHPHVLGDRTLALFSAALVLVKIFTVVLVSWGPVAPAFSSAINIENVISLTNESRRTFKLNTLTENKILNKAAQAKAEDMLAKGYFAHTTPDGHAPWDFITAAGYGYLMAGENLAVNFVEAEDVESAWMNSPGHKANILNKNFEEIGIGIAQGEYQGHNAIFVVQMFGLPAGQKIAINDTPTKVQSADVPAPKEAAAPEVRGVQNKQVPAPQPSLAITKAQTEAKGNMLEISASISGSPVKAIAYFGEKAVMLSPKEEGAWVGQVNLSELAADNVSVRIKAFDIKGGAAELKLADFSGNTVENYHVLATDNDTSVKVSWLGKVFDPKSMEGKFYLFFIAGILTSMVLAIAIKRHVQHLGLIANSSLVAIFACLLYMAG
jgi:hypothetical protein